MLGRVILTRIIIGIVVFIIGGIVINNITNDPEKLNEVMSYEQERELGDQIYAQQIQTGQDGKLLQDPYLDSVLAVIMARLTDQLDVKHYDYSIQILDSAEVNAFTIPGGHMFFFTSMFDYIHNPEECAAIIAHEIGHNENRDVVRRLVKSYGQTLLVSLDPTMANQILNGLGQLSFAREQEDEADHFAYKTMVKAGIHPKYFANVMQSFEILEGEQGGTIPEILSDHPNSAKRKDEAINYPVPPDFEEIPFDVDWDAFKARLAQVTGDAARQDTTAVAGAEGSY